MAGINELLDQARQRLIRVTAEQAAAEQAAGALLVDTPTSEHRSRDGYIPSALVIVSNAIKSNISTNRNNLISGVDRCIHLNAMKKTTITSINRQTIKI